jgi:hypothetical protein
MADSRSVETFYGTTVECSSNPSSQRCCSLLHLPKQMQVAAADGQHFLLVERNHDLLSEPVQKFASELKALPTPAQIRSSVYLESGA